MLRFYSRRGSESPLVRSHMSCGYRACLVHFGIVRFLLAIPTEYEETRRMESAARCGGIFAQSHWLCKVFRREYVGGCAPPNLRQRAIGSLDSLHLIRGVSAICVSILALQRFLRGVRWGLRAPKPAPKSHWLSGLSSFDSQQSTSLPNLAIIAILEFSHSHCATLGYTERPCRLQFMAGRVVLYSTKFSCFARQQAEPAQPASRPQAARSRVARAKRCGRTHCVHWLRTRRPQLKCSR